MKKILVFIGFCLIHLVAFAQTPIEQVYLSESQEYGRRIFTTNDGGFLIQATFENNYRDCHLMKVNEVGDTLWTKTYGNDSIQFYCYDMEETSDGGYLMTGDYQSPFNYSMDSYIQKIDANGNQIWFNLFGDIAGKDHGSLVKMLEDNSAIVLGQSRYIHVGIDDYYGSYFSPYLSKFDQETGNLLATTSICLNAISHCDSTQYRSYDLETINNNIFWLGLPLHNIAEIGESYVDGDAALIVFDENLDTIFTINEGLNNYFGLSRTTDNHLLLYGEGIITKMDTLGNILWTTENSSPSIIHKLIETKNNYLLSIGDSEYLEPINGGTYSPFGNNTTYVCLYDSIGQLIWEQSFNSPLFPPALNVFYQIGNDIVESQENGFAFIGMSNWHIWFIKVDSLEELQTNTSLLTPIIYNDVFTISPNPFSTQTQITTNLTYNNAILNIYNSSGQKVKELTNIDSKNIIFYREKLPNGLYFIQLVQNDKIVISNKIVIE